MRGERAADLVLRGGSVYTVDAARRWAEAVAVRAGAIVAVGAASDVAGLVGRRTEVVELDGRMVVPGFHDAHVHPLSGGLERLQCDLTEGRTAEDYARLIREYAARSPGAEWITGGGWAMPAFPGGTPTSAQLDQIVSDRPACLFNRDHHGTWVNSRALELARVTRDTPDPVDGRIERDARGEPTGTLHEGAMELVARLMPAPSEAELERSLLEAQRYLHSLGIVGWQDAIVGDALVGRDILPTYIEAAERGLLTARVVGSLWWGREQDESLLEELRARRDRASVGRLGANSIKFMQDGVCENFTAAMIDPYLDGRGGVSHGNSGLSFFDPEALKRYVTLADEAGFQAHFHAIGDRAVREALDAVEAARRRNGLNDNRHHIAHIQVIHPDDLPRFRRLGVVPNAQPLWACMEPQMSDLTIPFIGPERAALQYPFGSLVGCGAVLACGSDWPVSSPDPLQGIHVAVNRSVPEERGEEWRLNPEQAVDLPTALAAYTMGSAYVSHLDQQSGSVEVGKRADLVVLDRDLFELPVGEIAKARVEMTIVDGEVVFGHAGG